MNDYQNNLLWGMIGVIKAFKDGRVDYGNLVTMLERFWQRGQFSDINDQINTEWHQFWDELEIIFSLQEEDVDVGDFDEIGLLIANIESFINNLIVSDSNNEYTRSKGHEILQLGGVKKLDSVEEIDNIVCWFLGCNFAVMTFNVDILHGEQNDFEQNLAKRLNISIEHREASDEIVQRIVAQNNRGIILVLYMSKDNLSVSRIETFIIMIDRRLRLYKKRMLGLVCAIG